MSASLHIPIAITAKTTIELSQQLLKVQALEYGRVNVIAIYYDSENKLHTLWYYPIRNLGGSVI